MDVGLLPVFDYSAIARCCRQIRRVQVSANICPSLSLAPHPLSSNAPWSFDCDDNWCSNQFHFGPLIHLPCVNPLNDLSFQFHHIWLVLIVGTISNCWGDDYYFAAFKRIRTTHLTLMIIFIHCRSRYVCIIKHRICSQTNVAII